MIGFVVSSCSSCNTLTFSRILECFCHTIRPDFNSCSTVRVRAYSSTAPFCPAFTSLCNTSSRLDMVSKSFKISSYSTTSISDNGSTLFATCVMSPSSKTRTTSAIASTSRICERNLLPRPWPIAAPLTNPAMSTNSITAGTIFFECESSASLASRASGTSTTPTLGSIVQKG